MKKYIGLLSIVLLLGTASCSDDFLEVYPTSSMEAGGAATEDAIVSNLAACYQILLFDNYANGNYNSVVLMSDFRSDDIFKGGGTAGDQGMLYRLSQFDCTPDEVPQGLWSIYYSGLARCNNAILACENAVGVSETKLNQYKAEAHFLRAYYVHWLWKFWGNIPYFEADLPAPYMAPQFKADDIYKELIEDVDMAIAGDKLPMRTAKADDGRASKAAAMMLKARIVMYQKDQSKYAQVLADMAEIIKSGMYNTTSVIYDSIWVESGEFCDESIFESNQLPEGKTWSASWQGYGTNLPAFISPSELKGSDVFQGGWGFGPVRADAFAIYEEGDKRRNVAINAFEADQYAARFQNTGYFMGKYAARKGYNPPPGDVDLNYQNNLRIFRYAEALLNAAELMVIHGVPAVDGILAQQCLDQVRARGGVPSIPATAENIKLERRREFLGEGIRFWDLVRWGDTHLLSESLPAFNSVRTWTANEKYLPIPQSEIDKTEGQFKLVQNEY
ncbi:MAG: RagB/SusD family nutrient uptake outer membrane protein [Marinilabiliaceae bacterium]|nr:RagB/SusD family nutrient uptake outer membrane protein [Marinilabiliaceae bacterium]